ncbi:hypothetical protein C8R46DRAFT_1042909 [Mycena filopes]|nr:hypothetical protein C8R46DRAFT_1042909 [Mycena filopes]
MFFLCDSISVGLNHLAAGKFRKRKKGTTTPSERRPWPGGVHDILPGGATPAEVLDTLLRWAVAPGHGYSAFSLICTLANFWEPFSAEVVNRPDVFILATQHLQHTADIYPGTALAGSWACLPLKSATDPFVHCSRSRSTFSHLAQLITPLLGQLDAIGERLAPILESMPDSEARRWFTNVRHMIDPPVSRNVKEPEGIGIASGLILIEGDTEPLPATQEIYLRTFMAIWEARNRNRCLRIGCKTPMVRRSAVCARCGVVRYCSRECQRTAWKDPDHPVHPHKLLCDNICKLRTALKMLEDGVWDGLVLDPGIGRSPTKLLEICRPFSWEVPLGIVFAVEVGLELLLRIKSKEVIQNNRILDVA